MQQKDVVGCFTMQAVTTTSNFGDSTVPPGYHRRNPTVSLQAPFLQIELENSTSTIQPALNPPPL
jgi:hypothetical protein